MPIVLALAGCRVDANKCEQACRNSATLKYWREADKAIAASPAEQRDALRKQKVAELDKMIADGLDGCVLRCQSGRNEDQVDCLIAARTAEQATTCTQ